MSDLAKGPAAGYIFQFEKALLMLSKLNATEYISIENVDDIATHNNKSVLLSVQAKHSISSSGTTFQDTSYSLWRTFQIWIEKIAKGIYSDETNFVCSTNKIIPQSSLLFKIRNEKSHTKTIKIIEDLLQKQESKLLEIKANGKSSGKHLEENIALIRYVLSNQMQFFFIQERLLIDDNETIHDEFYNRLNLGSENYTLLQKENIFEAFYGWLVQSSIAKWNNGKEARISKSDFDNKWYQINSNPAIINAVFRTKQQLDSLGLIDDFVLKKMRSELFVKQIEDIKWRTGILENKVKEAVINFIYRENELIEIIKRSNYTKVDFDEFVENCYKRWENIFDSLIVKDFSEYTDIEKNELAIAVFYKTMDIQTLKFKEFIEFNSTNEYFLKGSFIELSNRPRIGWHPEWNNKYLKE